MLLKYISEGVPVGTACRLVGLGTRTFYTWQSLGQDDEAPPEFRQFRQGIEKAKAEATARRVGIIEAAAADGTWQAAAWLLERTQPEDFSLKQNLSVQHAPMQVEVKQGVIDIDRIAAILEVFVRVGAIPSPIGAATVGDNMQP